MSLEKTLRQEIQEIPDFPKPGISFKDITPLFLKPALLSQMIEKMGEQATAVGAEYIAGIDARGFLLGPALAIHLNLPFVPIRKAGKLPRACHQKSYSLEYGEATLELHKNDIPKGAKVFVHDDLLATGGTALAAAELLQKAGTKVCGFQFLVELSFLNAAKELSEIAPVCSLLKYT